jgi:glycosyltransferase involved in cell wall biosynthesis
MENLPQRVALVYDWVNKWGGAEQVLLALHEIFPDAPLYTAVYSPGTSSWAKVFPKIIPTFLQKFPFAATRHELYPWLTPLAFESLRFNGYETVISVTSADAKGIITQPGTFHLCYCLTPTRYLWSHFSEYYRTLSFPARLISKPVFSYLKKWDLVAASRPDSYVAISRSVQKRISKYYGRDSQIVHPPVNLSRFSQPLRPSAMQDYYLYVGRLVTYKRVDVIIRVFNELGLPLVIVGTGEQEGQLRSLAGPHIHFAGFVTHEELISYYQNCKALIFFHEEDFGIVPVEAQATGKPVIALKAGGAMDTVVDGVTGVLLDDPSPRSLKRAVLEFNPDIYDPEIIKKHTGSFSRENFREKFVKVLASEWKKHRNTFTS